MWASSVSDPTRSARTSRPPVPLIVPPTTLPPTSFSTGIGSPEIIDSTTELRPSPVQRWSKGYMAMATVLSMLLNAYEFAAHAPDHWFSKALSIGFGLVLPVMIDVLARQAGGLWSKK